MPLENNKLYNGDCLEVMKEIPDKSIDMILCDLPYQTTACAFDTLIPFEPLWNEYKRIIKDYSAIVLFGAQPFTSKLIMSNFTWFKYQWVWAKSKALGFTNAKNKPMNKHEDICVFSNGTCANCSPKRMRYYPQDLVPYNKMVKGRKTCAADTIGHKFGRESHKDLYNQEFTNYPTSILDFPNDGKTIHPTQKSLSLCEYLIKSYTTEGDLVLDNCSGSGTTLLAAKNTNRNFIGIEKELDYFNAAQNRINSKEAQNAIGN